MPNDTELLERRARFVYEGARLHAIHSQAPIVPALWEDREEAFKRQFLPVIERQCGCDRSSNAEGLHQSWVKAYEAMGWKYGEHYDPAAKTHPDMVVYAELEPREQAKDAVFIVLCEIARNWIH